MDQTDTNHRLVTGTVPRSLQIGFSLTASARIKETPEFEALLTKTEEAKTAYMKAQIEIIIKAQTLESHAQVKEIACNFITLTHDLVYAMFLHNLYECNDKTLSKACKIAMLAVLPSLTNPGLSGIDMTQYYNELFLNETPPASAAAAAAGTPDADANMADAEEEKEEENNNPFLPAGLTLHVASPNNIGVIKNKIDCLLIELVQIPLLLHAFVRNDLKVAKAIDKLVARREAEKKTNEVDEVLKAGTPTDKETIEKLVEKMLAEKIKKQHTRKPGKYQAGKGKKKFNDNKHHPKVKAGDSSRHGQNHKKSPSKGKGKAAGPPKGDKKEPKGTLKNPSHGKKRVNTTAGANSNKRSKKN